MDEKRGIVFFDGYCVLCSRSVRFIYRNDPKGKFLFDTLDSDRLKQLRSGSPPASAAGPHPGSAGGSHPASAAGLHPGSAGDSHPASAGGPHPGSAAGSHRGSASGTPSGSGDSRSSDSVILYRNGRLYTRSSAALRIAAHLRFPWPLAALFLAVPRGIRDAIYDWIARNRYRWFGKRETCFLPDGGMKNRFL